MEATGGHIEAYRTVTSMIPEPRQRRRAGGDPKSYGAVRRSRCMAARKRRVRVTGIGGIFFKAKDPKALARWYREHLGLQIDGLVALFSWRTGKPPGGRGHTVWSIFPAETAYFGKGGSSFMINYRVKDLDGLLAVLRREGIDIDPKVEDTEYGRFGWITDPEGNRIELWQPPKAYSAPETALAME